MFEEITKPILLVMKQVTPEAPKPYRIIETYLTTDGMRSRICSGVFATEQDARNRVAQLEAALSGAAA